MRIENAYQFIDKGYCEHFVLEEWPVPKDLKLVDYRVIEALDDLRESFGAAMYPSKKPGGLVRTSGSKTSRHYVGDGRLGLAVDVFPSVDVLGCWLHAVGDNRLRGIGIYLDTIINTTTQPQPMLHLDIDPGRPQRTFWVRNNGEYIVQSLNPEKFWNLIPKAFMKQ